MRLRLVDDELHDVRVVGAFKNAWKEVTLELDWW